MRLILLCAVAALAGGQALAADPMDGSVLRGSTYGGEPVAAPPLFVPGSPVYRRWEGVYFGAHAGLAGAGVDFGNGTRSLIDYILRNDVVGTHVRDWTTLSQVRYAGELRRVRRLQLAVGWQSHHRT
jgi:hypothetical protein